MRRAPAKPVRACTLRKWCLVSHVTFEAPLHTSQLTVFTLHSPHFTLHSSHCTLRSQHFTSHCTLKTPHFTLHTSHCTLHALSHCTLHTPNFTLHTSHCALHAPHFTLHSSHPTLHLVWALLTWSQLKLATFFLAIFMSSERSSNLLMRWTYFQLQQGWA